MTPGSSCLVTGAGGFLGTKVVASLARDGKVAIRAQFRRPTGTHAGHPNSGPNSNGVQAVPGNLLSQRDCTRLVEDVDTIIHCAAGTRGGAADMYLNSVVATRNLVRAAIDARIRRFVLVSSFSVYDTYTIRSGALLDENTGLETIGIEKGPYAYSKVQQEKVCIGPLEAAGVEVSVVRPGVIYGPGNAGVSSRVGIRAFGNFFRLGRRCVLPLTYVDNCADAVALAASSQRCLDRLNVVDDDLPTCDEYFREYSKIVGPSRSFPVPYPLLMAGAKQLVRYSTRSRGQLPAILTPYIVRSMYRPLRYSNIRLREAGWHQAVPTPEGMQLTFEATRRALDVKSKAP